MDDLTLIFKRLRSFSMSPIRNQNRWKNYIMSLPCVGGCGRPAQDPHHIFGSMGSLKSSDIFTVPVCRECHNTYEANPQANKHLIEHWVILAHNFIREETKPT